MYVMRTFAVLPFVSLALAQTLTGAFDCEPAGNFQLCQNLWGACKWGFILIQDIVKMMLNTTYSCWCRWAKLDAN